MKSQDPRTNRLVAYIKDHSIDARVRLIEKEPGYFVEVLEGKEEGADKDGKEYSQWVALAPDFAEVRDWLGY